MSKVKWMAGSCFALALALLVWGCAGKAGLAVPFDATKGEHPADWIPVHYAEFVKSADQCRSCHGSTSVPAQGGGVAKVSCFDCHTAVEHPAGWADHLQHGRNGAQLAPVATTAPAVPVMAGFSHCQKCHGADYSGGIAAVSCKSCHTKAPHPDKPWVSTSLLKSTHVETDRANAPACVQCHYPGSANNPAGFPATPAPAGTAPGCFNNTLCHGVTIPAAGTPVAGITDRTSSHAGGAPSSR
jgi:hypothetical protein